MELSQYLSKRIREVFLDGKWIANTNYCELLETISWEQATRKKGALNSIAALTFHINYYVSGLITVFNGGPLTIRDKYSFDMPPIDSEAAWRKMASTLFENADTFSKQVASLSAVELQEPFVDAKYGTNLRNIEAVIEHAYYHLGQISLLKKMLLEDLPTSEKSQS